MSHIVMKPENFKDLVSLFIDLIQTALPVIVGLALVVFIWGLVKFIFRVGGDEGAVEEGKKLMIWGLIALFVMISIWSILSLVYSDFGFDQDRPFGIPLLPQ